MRTVGRTASPTRRPATARALLAATFLAGSCLVLAVSAVGQEATRGQNDAALAERAARAAAEGQLREFRAWLDRLRVTGDAGREELRYWGALSLQAGTPADSVARAFLSYLADHPEDASALAVFAEVLEANAASDVAERLREAAGRDVKAASREGNVALRQPSPLAREALTGLEEARRAGDAEILREALERAVSQGVDPAWLAVPRGDLHLAKGAPDSALAAYAGAVGRAPRPAALEALGRVRLVQALATVPRGANVLLRLGRTLLAAPSDPRGAAGQLDSLAAALGSGDAKGDGSVTVATALLVGLGGEWRGEAGDPVAASRTLEAAAERAGEDGVGLLLAAGRWARIGGDEDRARALWRTVVERHPGTPYELEARRLLAAPAGTTR